MMGQKMKIECKYCKEPILLVKSRSGKWDAIEYPDNSLSRNWTNHRCKMELMRRKY